MALKKRDFQKIAQHIQEFLNKLICDEYSADLRDALNLALLYMQRYYKTLRSRSHSNTISPRSSDHRSLSGTLLFTSSSGAISPVSPACGVPNQFEWKWVNLESPKLSVSLGTSEFSSLSPFLHAVKTGDVQVMKEMLEQDPLAVNSVDGLGRNGVMYAVYGNTEKHTECLELIVRQTECLLDHQANDESTALHVAAHKSNKPALSLLLQNKASCNIVDNEGRTALHWAAANPSVDNLKQLLQHGASITANDCEGLTPAMWACHFEQLQNLLLLKSALARTDPREEALYEETDLKGRTVVHWAVNKTGSIDCLKELLTGSSGLLCDREKKNVLHTAAEQGIMAACQLVLDVCGSDCLFTTDNKGRTPLHLAALCGHAEIVNFLLEQGANLSIPDNNGLTAVDIIKRKHLYYCMMVLGLNPQYQSLCSSDKDMSAIIIPCLDADKEPRNKKISPSAQLPANEVHHETSQNSSNRRKSEPVPPKPLPRSNRKKSAPVMQNNNKNMDNVQEQYTHKDSITDSSQKSIDYNTSEERERHGTGRRQSLLMRQGGIQEELMHGDSGTTGTTLEIGTELVMLGDMDDLQTHVGDLDDGDLEIDCGNDHDDEENFAFSGHQLAEERGSPSSVHSEPDHADNCSVSVEISVSSLGSDNDEIVHCDDNGQEVNNFTQSSLHSSQHQAIQQSPASGKTSFAPHPPQDQPHSHLSENHSHSSLIQSQSSQVNTHPLQMNSSQSNSYSTQVHPASTQQIKAISDDSTLHKEKKKKKKNNNKKKLSSDSDPPYPIGSLRGVIAPLDPPDIRGSSKLGGAVEIMTPRPGPWEHASLGILRRGSPESPRSGHHQTPEEIEADVFDGRGNRPWTPEPPPSPRNVNNKHHSSPLVTGEMFNSPASGAMAQSQALLRNTDMMRGPQTGKLDTRTSSNMASLSRSKSPQHTFSLHGPIPHPPQKH